MKIINRLRRALHHFFIAPTDPSGYPDLRQWAA